MECLHTYSLIHDDLPALDDDDLRRGKPTCHKAHGEDTAILAGDALLTYAFELVARNALVPGVGPARALEAATILARAAGPEGMVAGQVMDLESEGRRVGLSVLRSIHARKTGELLTACLLMGASLAGVGMARRQALAAFGRHVGLAFQIADDILNVTGDEKKIGKRVGSDAKLDKATYPSLLGLKRSRAYAGRELRLALKALKPLGPKARPLAALAKYVVERDS